MVWRYVKRRVGGVNPLRSDSCPGHFVHLYFVSLLDFYAVSARQIDINGGGWRRT